MLLPLTLYFFHLTRILQTSLGGNAKTSIVSTISPTSMDETLSILLVFLEMDEILSTLQVFLEMDETLSTLQVFLEMDETLSTLHVFL